MWLVISCVIFNIVITVHEFGHFICAKLSGINVYEFSVGMGPKLIQHRFGGTMYSFRFLPIGGFCTIDENNHEFYSSKILKKIIVLFSGAGFNFIFGFIAVTIMVSMMNLIPTTQIKSFRDVTNNDGTKTFYSQSYKTGLRHDDVIVEIDGISIYSILDLNVVFDLYKKEKHDLIVKRDGKKVKLSDIKFYDEVTGDIIDFKFVTKDKSVLTVMKYSGDILKSIGHIIVLSFENFVTGHAKTENISGPIGIIKTIKESTQQSKNIRDKIFNILYITSFITVNIGIINLLPIPGLDGSKILFGIISFLCKKPIKYEGYINFAGLLFIFGILIFATFNDIIRLIKKI